MEFIKLNSNTDYARFNVINFPNKVIDFINEVLKRPDKVGEIFIYCYGRIRYFRGKLEKDTPKAWSNLEIVKVEAESSWSITNYFLCIKNVEPLNNKHIKRNNNEI